jgi:hypothetical protein
MVAQGRIYLFISNKNDGAISYRMDIEETGIGWILKKLVSATKFIGKNFSGFLPPCG